MKHLTPEDVNTAVTYAINPYSNNYSKLEERHFELGARRMLDYLRAVRMAKANPDITFKTGLTTWWPTTGAEVMEQFRAGMTERINQAVPYTQRGKKP